LLPVTVETIELTKNDCVLFSHFYYFATLPIARSCAHLVSLGTFGLACGPKSGFEYKCQVRACDFWFRLQIKTRLQLWVAGRLHFDKGLQFCFTAEFTIDYVF